MEKFMKNEILQPVIETLQYKVNSTLGEFAKAFIERSDYETLGSIAKIGIDVNSFLDGLFLSFSSLEQLPLIEAELIIENDDEPEVVEVVTKNLPEFLIQSLCSVFRMKKLKTGFLTTLENVVVEPWLQMYVMNSTKHILIFLLLENLQ